MALGLEVDDDVHDLGVGLLQRRPRCGRPRSWASCRLIAAVDVDDEVHVDGVAPAAGAHVVDAQDAGHRRRQRLELLGRDHRAVGEDVEGAEQDLRRPATR